MEVACCLARFARLQNDQDVTMMIHIITGGYKDCPELFQEVKMCMSFV
jgi:hypothetical protein